MELLPDSIIDEFILPHLSVKDLGNLSQTSTEMKYLCDKNHIWEPHYVKSLPHKEWIITDESVHIGELHITLLLMRAEYNVKCVLSRKKIISLIGYQDKVKQFINEGYNVRIIPRPHLPKNALKYFLFKQLYSHSFQNCCCGHFCTHNVPNITDIVFPDGSIIDKFTWSMKDSKYYRDCYYDYIIELWEEYNKKRGLSSVNLCQTPEHYLLESLQPPTKYRKFDNYKQLLFQTHLNLIIPEN